jgi:hypothetical protein
MRNVRIFLSSPGDVLAERHRARQVIDRLAKRFAEALSIDALFWEWEPREGRRAPHSSFNSDENRCTSRAYLGQQASSERISGFGE